jgi:hypothetical protein
MTDEKQYEIIYIEEDETYCVVIKDKYDEDEERTIIGASKNKEEAVGKALESALEALKNCHSILYPAKEAFEECDRYGGPQISIESFNVEKPLIDDDGKLMSKSYSAVWYNEDLKRWGRFYR